MDIIATPRIKARVIPLEQNGEQEGQRAEITFTYPERHNIIDLQGWQALPPLLAQLAGMKDMRLITCRGAGDKAFVAGADIAEFDDSFSGKTASTYEQATMDAFDALANCPIPTLAAITGYCIGGGLALATCCDLRLAREGSQFAVPAARLGLAYPANAVRALQKVVGDTNARYILFTAATFNCQQAADMGLLTDTASAAAFEARLDALTTQICANAPLSLRAAISALATPTNLESVKKNVAICANSADYAEGRAAFKAKRTPHFKGE